jgi:integrase
LYTKEIITRNPVAAAVRFHIPAKKTIDVLEKKEAKKLLNAVENTDLDSPNAAARSKRTVLRDTAIVTLLLNSGIRIAELVGLDVSDVDFDNGCIYIIRKGGAPDKVYLNDQTLGVLKDYIDLERPAYSDGGKETALFLSNRKKRMAVRSIQEMLKKYGSSALPSRRHLSPHTLRRTYGTALYEATGDLKNTQAVLGHTDVRTTSKYYVRESDIRKEQSGRKNLFDL